MNSDPMRAACESHCIPFSVAGASAINSSRTESVTNCSSWSVYLNSKLFKHSSESGIEPVFAFDFPVMNFAASGANNGKGNTRTGASGRSACIRFCSD
jgi:hypothetical protein